MNPPENLHEEIERLLRQAGHDELKNCGGLGLDIKGQRAAFDCVRSIVETRLRLGQRKLAGRWLAWVPSLCAPEDFPIALSLALKARQITIVQMLCERIVIDAIAEPPVVLSLARDTLALALRLRLPFGRHGAWRKHMDLLDQARGLVLWALANGLPGHLQNDAESILRRIKKLQGNASQGVGKCAR